MCSPREGGAGGRERLPSFTGSHWIGKKQASWMEVESGRGKTEGQRDGKYRIYSK